MADSNVRSDGLSEIEESASAPTIPAPERRTSAASEAPLPPSSISASSPLATLVPTKAESEYSASGAPTCRICRSEATDTEPLFYPCKCSGSIKHVHQECLMEWLSHSHKKHCELCRTAFCFTKLYDASMPARLPIGVFIYRGAWHLLIGTLMWMRRVAVMAIWLMVLPFAVRWAWRWIFWTADAGWARDSFASKLRVEDLVRQAPAGGQSETYAQAATQAFQNLLDSSNRSADPMGLSWVRQVSDGFAGIGSNTTSSAANVTAAPAWAQTDVSLLSRLSFLANLTTSQATNRCLIDILEGQCITLFVVICFILVFLLREWVVQQQPLVALEQAGQQGQEAAARVEEDNRRLQQQQLLLEEARQRLLELKLDTAEADLEEAKDGVNSTHPTKEVEFVGWERLATIVRIHVTSQSPRQLEPLQYEASYVVGQMKAAIAAGEDIEVALDKMYDMFSGMEAFHRKMWEDVILDALLKDNKRMKSVGEALGVSAAQVADETDSVQEQDISIAEGKRPAMPDKDTSSRAADLNWLIGEIESLKQSGEAVFVARERGEQRALLSNSELHSRLMTERAESTEDGGHADSQLLGNSPGIDDHGSTTRADELPIANAGPDAKINIKRGDKSKGKMVPAPKEPPPLTLRKITIKTSSDVKAGSSINKQLPGRGTTVQPEGSIGTGDDRSNGQQSGNPSRPEVADPPPQDESFSATMRSAFREEFGIDEAEQPQDLAAVGLDPVGDMLPEGEEPEGAVALVQRRPAPRPNRLQRVADWFWGDINAPQVAGAEPTVVPAREERVHNGSQEVPIIPVANGEPRPSTLTSDADPTESPTTPAAPQQPAQLAEDAEQPAQDPEVVAAAQQAGLDAEAVEDAEDLEGIMELLGLQGPVINLIQTSIFCHVLICASVLGAIGVPYMWGKLVLNIIGEPFNYFVGYPLKAASFTTDLLLDGALVMGGIVAYWTMRLCDIVLLALKVDSSWLKHAGKATAGIVHAAWVRAGGLFLTGNSGGTGADESWAGAFIGASIHSHASLRELQGEISACLAYAGGGITAFAETVSTHTVPELVQKVWRFPLQAKELPNIARQTLELLAPYKEPVLAFVNDLRHGALTLASNVPQADLDPSLAYWSALDRFWAVFIGYLALAMLATVYVSIDRPLTSSPGGQKREKAVRDTLKQAGGVLKVMLIISIEMLLFPLYCGVLLDLALLPLFEGATVVTRLAFATTSPYTFGFMHWFIGTCYMFHFALFVSMCRKILRQGVLWFIRDPDDPTFHPVRDVLERDVATQLRKIAFSALVYGALVILCLGGVVWTIAQTFEGVFPIHWLSTEPLIEFPVDLLLYNFLTPVVIKLFKPSDAVQAAYAWWLRRCARLLRLSDFLFDDRRKDEEGHHIYRSYTLSRTYESTGIEGTREADGIQLGYSRDTKMIDFEQDGKWVLTPSSDQYRPPKPGDAILQIDDEDAYVTDRDGKRNEHFAKVYVPPYFRVRISLFMVCLWFFAAVSGVGMTIVPLVFGRTIFAAFVPEVKMNDIYAYSIGAYSLGGMLYCVMQARSGVVYVKKMASNISVMAWFEPAKRYTVQALKCVYFYGFLGLGLPSVFALVLHFYLLLPLHTYTAVMATSATQSAATSTTTSNATDGLSHFLQSSNTTSTATGPTVQNSFITPHSINILQDYALGLLYARIAARLAITTPSSRAATAFKRITQDGYLNPNAHLATRFFVLPLLLLTSIIMLVPPVLAKAGLVIASATTLASVIDETARTLVYRYSFPFTALAAAVVWAAFELGEATERWRARIRDEVYLVGERLHNFGEKRPPAGSKTVVRREK